MKWCDSVKLNMPHVYHFSHVRWTWSRYGSLCWFPQRYANFSDMIDPVKCWCIQILLNWSCSHNTTEHFNLVVYKLDLYWIYLDIRSRWISLLITLCSTVIQRQENLSLCSCTLGISITCELWKIVILKSYCITHVHLFIYSFLQNFIFTLTTYNARERKMWNDI